LTLVLLVSAVALVFGSVVAAVVAQRLAARRLRRELAAADQRHGAALAELRIDIARLEERHRSALDDGERLRTVEAGLRASLLTSEQEKARLDYELRQVGLVASRVPQLEARLAEMEGLRTDLDDARRRIAELEPLATELDVRNQYVDTLQREIGYRDERLALLEHRVSRLDAQLAATHRQLSAAAPPEGVIDLRPPLAGSVEVDVATAPSAVDVPAEADPAAVPPSADPPSVKGQSAGDADLSVAIPTAPAPGCDSDVDGGLVRREVSVERALSQALSALGVASFGDLACVADPVAAERLEDCAPGESAIG